MLNLNLDLHYHGADLIALWRNRHVILDLLRNMAQGSRGFTHNTVAQLGGNWVFAQNLHKALKEVFHGK